MRFETHRVSVYLVEMLKVAAPVRAITVDGGDIIQLELHSGETVSIHLIESAIELYEIRSVLQANTRAGIHSIFLLWRDLLLPPHGYPYLPPDWASALFDLYGCIYAYDFNGPDIFIFPVYLDATYPQPTIRFGRTIDPSRLTAQTIHLNAGALPGFWRVAGFDGQAEQYGPARYYELLGVTRDAPLAAVKRAYRRLARQLHPDVNAAPDAHARMQALNEAYRAILEERGEI
ncbi:MAG: DnaJ domain-containing protein [Chloroflexota bacterium]